MPLVLDAPEQVTIASVRITNFTCIVSPLTATINFERGFETAEGFKAIDSGSVCFDQDQIAEVDPTGSIYSSLKDALYELLKVHVGTGTVE